MPTAAKVAFLVIEGLILFGGIAWVVQGALTRPATDQITRNLTVATVNVVLAALNMAIVIVLRVT